jgi:putative peptide zinc metalloprotease protein
MLSMTAPLAGGRPQTDLPALREELQITTASANRDGSPAWHLCDPVRNLFFRIGWLEFEILQRWQLGDAQTIAQDVRNATTLAAQAEDVEQFGRFLAQHQLVRGVQKKPAIPLWRWLLNNYLFIRIPLVRPAQWLDRLMPWVRWLFSPWFISLTVVAALVGIAFAVRQFDTVAANLRGALSWDGLVGFAGALLVSKLVHELGHALVSTRHGARVGHMGVALLVMWPMLYTDTGESWKLERSRHRFAIASAGISAELVLAAWATFLWSFMPEGNFRNALFFLATTAWVLTLLVNGSPFMRFDGYYMLSDALDFPGLHERAGQQARRTLRYLLLGIEDPAGEVLPAGFRRFLIGFAFATWIYRLVLFVGIALLVYHAFFKALGLLLAMVELGVFIGRPVLAELRVWWQRRAEIPRRRLLGWALVLAVAALLLGIPWASGISAPGVLTAASEQPIYSPFAARLEKLEIRDGTTVQPGAVLVELDAPNQAQEREKAAALAAAYLRSARGALGLAEDGAARSALAEQLASRYEAEQRAREAELQRLHIVANRQGVVRDVDLELQPGTWIAPSQRLAMVIDGRRWRVEALVSERDRQRLETGGRAVVIVKGRTRKLEGSVVAIDNNPVERLPHLLLAQDHGGPVPLNPTLPVEQLRPAEAWFRVLIEGEAEAPVSATYAVQAHFEGRPESIARGWLDSVLSVLIQQSGL